MTALVRWRSALRLAVILSLVALAAEATAAYVHFQRSSDKGIAIGWLAGRFGEHLGLHPGSNTGTPVPASADAKRAYARRFAVLADAIASFDIPLIVLYVPQFPVAPTQGHVFFLSLCVDHHLTCVDLTEVFHAYPADWLYQVPSDTHLSPLGHRLVAASLLGALRGPLGQRALSRRHPREAGTILRGPHPKGVDEIRVYGGLAYRVVTNSNGFRMSREIDPSAQRLVLALGDSFTFGTTVDTEFVYPTIVARELPGTAMLNAGIPGAGIEEESRVFFEMPGTRALSLVVLQVLDDDLQFSDDS